MDIAAFRTQFPLTEQRCFLYSGAFTPAALAVQAAMEEWCRRWASDPAAIYNHIAEEENVLRAAFAGLIGAAPAEVAITDGTSRGANIAVRLLARRPGSNVVVDETTYPSALYPWFAASSHAVRMVATTATADPTAALAEAIDPGTVAVSISHVAPETGFRHDLASIAVIAREVGAVLVVDAAQSTGVVPIDVSRDGVDVLVSTAMKWLLGPPGVGFLYVREDLARESPALEVGYRNVAAEWGSWPQDSLPPLFDDARRFQLGVPNLAGLAPARAGISLLQQVGIESIGEHVAGLVASTISGVGELGFAVRTPAAPDRRAGVVAFEHPDAVALGEHAHRLGIDVGAYPWGLVRVDPHAFNTHAEIDRFLAALASQRT